MFDFVTRTEHLIKWWGPEGTTIGEHDLDLSRPGPWFFVLVDPSGGRHRVSGEVLAVTPPRSVEFTLIVHNPAGPPMIDSLVRFDVSAIDATTTRFVLTQSGLADDQVAAMSNMGWVSTLGRLQQTLEGEITREGN